MEFQDAVIFLSAVIVIVSAGVVLGAALRGRSARRSESVGALYQRKADLYADIIGILDSLVAANDQQKQWFINRYYQALVYAPDNVISALNRYLDGITAMGADLSPEKIMELRGKAVQAMRNDVQGLLNSKSKLAISEMYRIEVKSNEPLPKKKPEETEPNPIGTPAQSKK